jgi:hypothetical protein
MTTARDASVVAPSPPRIRVVSIDLGRSSEE